MQTPSVKSLGSLIVKLAIGRTSERIRALLTLMRWAKLAGYGKVATLCSRLLERHGLYVSKNATIGDKIALPHPAAIVIGDGVTIGNNVTIYQSVTLGGRVQGDWKRGNYPTISDGCTLFAGVVVAGKVHIGANCVIGSNSVVLSDIPDNAVAVGAPARVVKQFSTPLTK